MTSGSATQVPQAGDLVELKAPTVTIPNKLLVLAEEMFEEPCFLLRCISPLLERSGHAVTIGGVSIVNAE